MPRVAMVVDSLRGGLGGAVAAGSHWLSDRGWDVVVLAPATDDAPDLAATFEPVALPGSARQLRAAGRAGKEVRRLLRHHRPDVVHCHGLRSFAVTTISARRRAVLTLHTMLEPGAVADDPPGYHHLRSAAVGLLPRVALHAFSVAPGVNPRYEFAPHASPRLASFDQLAAAEANAPFLWVARLEAPKQPVAFVEAIANAHATVPSISALIAGSGPLVDDVRQCVRSQGAPVELLGERDDVVDLLRRSCAVVLLSRGEGVPLALIEAMWAGRAVVASRLPGTEWLAGGADNGVTLIDDPRELTGALVRLADPAVAAADGALAAARVRSLLTADAPWPQVERAYRAVLARG